MRIEPPAMTSLGPAPPPSPDPAPVPIRATARASRGVRVTAFVSYLAVAASWIYSVGIPAYVPLILAWIWAASIAWNIHKPLPHHLAFVRDWWLPLALLTAYTYTRGVADQLGTAVAVETPITIDTWLGGGELPTVRLQQALCSGVCSVTDVQWFDYVFSLTYMSHFVVGLTIAGVLWISDRPAWIEWMRRYMLLTGVALITYVLYPMAPPWLAGEMGLIDDPIVRLTSRGWESFGIPVNKLLLGETANVVAAMPSLHAGMAVLVAVWGIRRCHSALRWILLLYPTLMATALVFYADHYVIDILAALVAVALVEVVSVRWAGTNAQRLSSSPRPDRVAG